MDNALAELAGSARQVGEEKVDALLPDRETLVRARGMAVETLRLVGSNVFCRHLENGSTIFANVAEVYEDLLPFLKCDEIAAD